MASSPEPAASPALAKATAAFNEYAGMDAPHVPTDPFSALQVRMARWQARNFGYQPIEREVLGVSEEAGELAHAVLKGLQGIRGMDDREAYRAKAADALADIAIYSMQVATSLRIDYGTIIQATAEKVLERDWKKKAEPDLPSRPGAFTDDSASALIKEMAAFREHHGRHPEFIAVTAEEMQWFGEWASRQPTYDRTVPYPIAQYTFHGIPLEFDAAGSFLPRGKRPTTLADITKAVELEMAKAVMDVDMPMPKCLEPIAGGNPRWPRRAVEGI